MDLSGIYEHYAPLVGALGGDFFNVLRPDYTKPDNTPAVVYSNLRFRTDPTTGRFAEPRFEGVGYYDIFGPRQILKPGDILVKSTPDGMTPAVTVSSFMNVKTTTGFRSSRIGEIVDSKLDLPGGFIYSPVYFDFLGQGFPGSNLNRALMDSLAVPSQRVVIFNRPNVTRLRSHLIETDLTHQVQQDDGSFLPFQRTWIIDEIDFSGNLMVLTLRNR